MASDEASNLVEMGRVAGPYGIKGWVRVVPYTDAVDALSGYSAWRVGGLEYPVEESRPHSGTLLARLRGVDTPEAARGLKGSVVAVPRSALPEPPEGEFYWSDLVGFEVVNGQGEVFGPVEGVFSNGAHDVVEVGGERKRLLPWVDSVVKRVDTASRRIEVDWGADW